MKKSIFLISSVIFWIIAVSIVFFNNAFQLTIALLENSNLLASFLLITIGVTIYGIYNRNKLIRDLR